MISRQAPPMKKARSPQVTAPAEVIPYGTAYMWFSSEVFASTWRAGAIGAGGGGGGADAQAASERARAARADRHRIRVMEVLRELR